MLLLFLVCVGAVNLELIPNLLSNPMINIVNEYDTSFDINYIDNIEIDIMNKFPECDKQIKSIIEEFRLTYENGEVNTYKSWEFVIENHIGKLKMLYMEMVMQDNMVMFRGSLISGNVNIPTIYSMKEICARTGKRKYGIVGRRKMVCKNHHIERGLTMNEINIVSNYLKDKMTDFFIGDK